jgi:hypothetical protein
MNRGDAALRLGFVAVASLAAGCAKPNAKATDGHEAGVTSSASSSGSAPATSRAPTLPPPLDFDAGPSTCRVLLGPKQLPVRSPVALSLRGETVEAILNEDGKPRVVVEAAGAVASTAVGTTETLEGAPAPGASTGCAVGGDSIFCPDRGGNVHRTTRGGGEERLAGSGRIGSRIAAAAIDGHPALAYLASRDTSEGWVTEAWLAVDDAAAVRVSEDGAGATSIALAPRGAAILVLSVDARSALTAMHARVVTFDKGPKLGEDFVLFVGGPGERRAHPAVALGPTGAGLGLLPISKDVGDFGLALVRIDDPPHVDEPVGWSLYPNGLDPAPVAAAMGLGSSGTVVTWVARVRPVTPDPASVRIIEVGEVKGGTFDFTARQVVLGSSGTVKDLALISDGHGALWLAWLDGAGSWLERLSCK